MHTAPSPRFCTQPPTLLCSPTCTSNKKCRRKVSSYWGWSDFILRADSLQLQQQPTALNHAVPGRVSGAAALATGPGTGTAVLLPTSEAPLMKVEYLKQEQSAERAQWAATVRSATGRRKHTTWQPCLSPPALLSAVTIVLVSPRRPASVGTVARACSSFEVEDLAIVAPRCSPLSRQAKAAAKGAQYIMHNARNHATVADAIAGASLSVAFTRWTAGRANVYYDVEALLQHPAVQAVIHAEAPAAPETAEAPSTSASSQHSSKDAPTSNSSSSQSPEPLEATRPTRSHDNKHVMPASAQGGAALRTAPSDHAASPLDNLAHAQGDQRGTASHNNSPVSGSMANLSPPLSLLSSQGCSSISSSSSDSNSSAAPSSPLLKALPAPMSAIDLSKRVVLVFGREELGLADAEVDACDVICSIPIGRLQESLSLSHAVSIVLCGMYQHRLKHVMGTATTAGASIQLAGQGSPYVANSVAGLADGYDVNAGEER